MEVPQSQPAAKSTSYRPNQSGFADREQLGHAGGSSVRSDPPTLSFASLHEFPADVLKIER
jgi:hypothetical protein